MARGYFLPQVPISIFQTPSNNGEYPVEMKHESNPVSGCRSSVPDRRNPRGPIGFGRRSCSYSGSFWGGLFDHWRSTVSEQRDRILPWRNRTVYRSLCRPGNFDESPHSGCCTPRRNRGRSCHQLPLSHQEDAEYIENLKIQIPLRARPTAAPRRYAFFPTIFKVEG